MKMKPIPNYTNYSITDTGKVINTKTGKERKLQSDKDGYNYVTLYKKGRGKACKVHRLVAEAFLSDFEEKLQINHIDGDKNNNNVTNLECCTGKQNMMHASVTGLSGSKLKPDDVRFIRKNCLSNGGTLSCSQLAKMFGVYQSYVQRITRGNERSIIK